jgi:hypothetical protein
MPAIMNKTHNFKEATFSKPTFCDLCSNFVWGLAKQGFECQDCGYNAHKKCMQLVNTPCYPIDPQDRRSNDDAFGDNVSVAESHKSESLVTELFAETQNQTRKLAEFVSSVNPGLSMTNFVKQNNRFAARQYPMIWMQKNFVDLITWQNRHRTIIFLLCYTLVCMD